ncbi:uncharacterized protein [Oscarella lobularis]|uniref:uncharacterized protein isoform X2 n=1 Tax=Oscarella lobularis TaxID=121494 RepID=UPI003313D2E8
MQALQRFTTRFTGAVRRASLSAGLGHILPLFNIAQSSNANAAGDEPPPEGINDNLYKLRIYKLATKLKCSDSPEERMERGPEVAEFSGEHYLELLINILRKTSEPQCVKIEIVKALSEILRMNKANQDRARQYGLIDILSNYLMHINREMRMWSTHALFFLLCGNTENQLAALEKPKQQLQMRFIRVVTDDWSTWSHNEARECIEMLGLGRFEH